MVTGAARGLGEALARGLARRGARVALVDRNPAVIAVAGGLGVDCSGHVVDVADRGAVEALAQAVVERYGRVDLLVNNAGVAVAGEFESVPHADFEWLMNVNFWGVVHGCRAFLPFLRRAASVAVEATTAPSTSTDSTTPAKRTRGRPAAHIVNVVSSFAWLGFPGKSAYSASKAAVRAFSESLRAELATQSVGVTLLFPGPLDTGLIRDGRATDSAQRDEEAAFVAARAIPLERVVARTLRGIERNAARVVIGADYRLLDAAVRLSPTGTLAAVTRARRRFPF